MHIKKAFNFSPLGKSNSGLQGARSSYSKY